MAVKFNHTDIRMSGFKHENLLDGFSLSGREIENVLGMKMEPAFAGFIDSISPKEAYEILTSILSNNS